MPNPGAPRANHAPLDPSLPALPAAGSGRGAYYQDDGPGDNPPPGLRDVPDAEVRAEPLAKYANRPYTVLGKTYEPIGASEPFSQRGVASWYGKKFHGQRTSSGELYDMYKMTAAHPTLPIPSYARITSVSSGKSVVVRINDRGPFHANRIVDVSYTAALKLGLLEKGSHEVELERVLPGDPAMIATVRRSAAAPDELVALMKQDREGTAAASGSGWYLQLGAYSREEKAEEVSDRLMRDGVVRATSVEQSGAVYRVFAGPYPSRAEAQLAARALPGSIKAIAVRRGAD
ncbi:MAG: septal ring lytic transglycosylase RlpA family protein [Massilia sp.]|nr:septal ring lytic transglycosylase RlpA family protein [Massilia sp.]